MQSWVGSHSVAGYSRGTVGGVVEICKIKKKLNIKIPNSPLEECWDYFLQRLLIDRYTSFFQKITRYLVALTLLCFAHFFYSTLDKEIICSARDL